MNISVSKLCLACKACKGLVCKVSSCSGGYLMAFFVCIILGLFLSVYWTIYQGLSRLGHLQFGWRKTCLQDTTNNLVYLLGFARGCYIM